MIPTTAEGAAQALAALLEAKSDIDHVFAEVVKRHVVPRGQTDTSPGGQRVESPGDIRKEATRAVLADRFGDTRVDARSVDRYERAVAVAFEVFERARYSAHTALEALEEGLAFRGLSAPPASSLTVQAALAEIDSLRAQIARYEPQVIEGNRQWPRLIKGFAEITGRAVRLGQPLKDGVNDLLRFVHEIEDERRAAARRRQGAEAEIASLKDSLRQTHEAHDSCRTTCDSLRELVDQERNIRAETQAAAENWKARAIWAEAAEKPIEVPLLPADFVEMLAGRFVKLVDEPSDKRGATALRLAEDAETFLHHLGAQAAPALQAKSSPFLVWGRGYVTAENTPNGIAMSFKPEADSSLPLSSEQFGRVVQLAKELADAVGKNASIAPQMAFAPIYLGLEDAIGAGRVSVDGLTKSA